jgi:hypothetical protein
LCFSSATAQEAAKREAFKLTRFKGVRPRVYKHEQENDESNGGYPFLRRGNSEPSLHSERTTSEQQQQQQSSLPPAFHRPEKAPTRVPLKEPVPSLEELEERNRELVAKMVRLVAISLYTLRLWRAKVLIVANYTRFVLVFEGANGLC